jgi:ABC-type antimicrobial peptide transport system ATPase subunit
MKTKLNGAFSSQPARENNATFSLVKKEDHPFQSGLLNQIPHNQLQLLFKTKTKPFKQPVSAGFYSSIPAGALAKPRSEYLADT